MYSSTFCCTTVPRRHLYWSRNHSAQPAGGLGHICGRPQRHQGWSQHCGCHRHPQCELDLQLRACCPVQHGTPRGLCHCGKRQCVPVAARLVHRWLGCDRWRRQHLLQLRLTFRPLCPCVYWLADPRGHLCGDADLLCHRQQMEGGWRCSARRTGRLPCTFPPWHVLSWLALQRQLRMPALNRESMACRPLHLWPALPQGFLWGSMTGFAEPLGGLIGFLAVHEQARMCAWEGWLSWFARPGAPAHEQASCGSVWRSTAVPMAAPAAAFQHAWGRQLPVLMAAPVD